MKDIIPVPLTKNEILHNAFIDELFTNNDTLPVLSPPNERKVQTLKELQQELVSDYELKEHLTLGNMSWEEYLYENHVISYERLLNYPK